MRVQRFEWEQAGKKGSLRAEWRGARLSLFDGDDTCHWRVCLSGPPDQWRWGTRFKAARREWDLRDGWEQECVVGPPEDLVKWFIPADGRRTAWQRASHRRFRLPKLRSDLVQPLPEELTPQQESAIARFIGRLARRVVSAIEPSRLRAVMRLAPKHRLPTLWLLREDHTGRLLQLLEARPGLVLFRAALERGFGTPAALARFDEGIQQGRPVPTLEHELLEAWAAELPASLPERVRRTERRHSCNVARRDLQAPVATSFATRVPLHQALLGRLGQDVRCSLSALRLPLPASLSPDTVAGLTGLATTLRAFFRSPRLTATDEPRWAAGAAWLARRISRQDPIRARYDFEDPALLLADRLSAGRPAPGPGRPTHWLRRAPLDAFATPLASLVPGAAPFPVRVAATFQEQRRLWIRFNSTPGQSQEVPTPAGACAEIAPHGRPLLLDLHLDDFGLWRVSKCTPEEDRDLTHEERASVALWVASLQPAAPPPEDYCSSPRDRSDPTDISFPHFCKGRF